MAACTTSKWAVRGLTKAAAMDLAPFNSRVLSLHPALAADEQPQRRRRGDRASSHGAPGRGRIPD